MKPSQLRFAIADLRAMDIPLFIWGAAGIGKSDIVAQDALAQRAAAVAHVGLPDTEATSAMAAPLSDGTYYGLCDYRVYLREQVDAMGLPHITTEGVTAYAKPADLPNDPNWRGTIFFDEFCIGNPSQQSPAMQIFLGKGVGAFRLPRHAYLIAPATGRATAACFTACWTPSPTASRISTLRPTWATGLHGRRALDSHRRRQRFSASGRTYCTNMTRNGNGTRQLVRAAGRTSRASRNTAARSRPT